MFEIRWRPKALKQAEKIKDRRTRARLFDAVDTLRAFPNCPQVKHLAKHRYPYRLRVGRYRVFFSVYDVAVVIAIEEVKKRNERTYE